MENSLNFFCVDSKSVYKEMKQGGKIQSFFLYTLSIQVSSISNIIDAEQECVAFTQKRLKHVSVLFG